MEPICLLAAVGVASSDTDDNVLSSSSPRLAQLCVREVDSTCFIDDSPLTTSVYSEVFVVVALTLFLPICLEQFARDNGFLEPDRTQPCSDDHTDRRCAVKIGWLWIDTASFRFVVPQSLPYPPPNTPSLYVYSISVALQALTVISMGSIADRRKSTEYRRVQRSQYPQRRVGSHSSLLSHIPAHLLPSSSSSYPRPLPSGSSLQSLRCALTLALAPPSSP